jgi:hypothetical protein
VKCAKAAQCEGKLAFPDGKKDMIDKKISSSDKIEIIL